MAYVSLPPASEVCFQLCLSVPCFHYPWCMGHNHTGTGTPPPRVPALAPQRHGVSLYRVPQLHPPQICSNLFTVKYVRLASGQLASFLVVWRCSYWTKIDTNFTTDVIFVGLSVGLGFGLSSVWTHCKMCTDVCELSRTKLKRCRKFCKLQRELKSQTRWSSNEQPSNLFQVLSLVRSHNNGERARVYALLLPNQIHAPGCAAETPPRHGLCDSLLLRQCALAVQVSILHCFDSVPLLYRSVSFTASIMCPYCTGKYTLLFRQCDLTVSIPFGFDSVSLLYRSICLLTLLYRSV